jgi:hypothetical protein
MRQSSQMTDMGAFEDFVFFRGALSPPVEDFHFILLAFAINLACANNFVAFHWPWQRIQNMTLDFCKVGVFFQGILPSFVKSLTVITNSKST